jgi:predicted RNase H-like HicB family nuclease
MYAIEIFYSEEGEGFIAIVPELPGCSAFGRTEEAALKEVKTAMQLWLETLRRSVVRFQCHRSAALWRPRHRIAQALSLSPIWQS